ncbi:hypothetical protein [Alkalinema sp. FACHB-956]|uniref:LIC_10190 family membrane protein n=1 Tax=Alkalinema sp. FACHB-956 TaxID=2692768 RepID=UPI001682A8E3|nr:hypothetical protein [Alkalinema sp. FACHB-956]MBD2325662.1 hypothetical protein [Alkalinema sp. FACHB-956]
MLYFIVTWFLLAIVSCTIGIGLLTDLNIPAFPKEGDRAIVATWLGIVLLSATLLATSLVLPLTPWVGLAIAGLWCSVSLLRPQPRSHLRHLWQHLRPHGGLLLGLAAIAAISTNGQVLWHDTGYYHYSVLQWLGQYGSVPGIALLFNNLAFTSAWFALGAPLNPAALNAQVSAVTNGFILWLSLCHASLVWPRLWQRRASLADHFIALYLLAALPIALFTSPLKSITISPSPDGMMLFFIGTVAWAILQTATPEPTPTPSLLDPWDDRPPADPADSRPADSRPADSRPADSRLIALVLAAGTVTMKLTALPVLAIGLAFYLWQRPFRWGDRLVGLATMVAVLLPLVSASIVTSGCPLYPSSALCLDLPWSPTAQKITQVAQGTHGWTTWYGPPPSGVHPWLWAMWNWFISSPKEQITAIAILLALVGTVYLWKHTDTKSVRSELWVSALGVVGIGFIMATSPFFRFSVPYILVLLALISAVWLHRWPGRFWPPALSWSHQPPTAIVLFIAAVVTAIGLRNAAGWQILLPPQIRNDSQIVVQQTNGIIYFAPKSGDIVDGPDKNKDMCWAAPLPCAYEIPDDVYLRDPQRGIAGGFVRRR